MRACRVPPIVTTVASRKLTAAAVPADCEPSACAREFLSSASPHTPIAQASARMGLQQAGLQFELSPVADASDVWDHSALSVFVLQER